MPPSEIRLAGPDPEKSLDIRVDLPKSDLPPPQVANYFQLARFGLEIELLACFLDPHIVAEKARSQIAKSPKEKPKIVIQAEVIQRFAMSPQGFETLKASVEQMHQQMHGTSSRE